MAKEKEYGMTFRPKFRSLQIVHGKDGKDGINGKDGKDGYTPVKGVDYVDGYTPIKGVDYYTEADKNEIAENVLIGIKGDLDAISALVGGAE